MDRPKRKVHLYAVLRYDKEQYNPLRPHAAVTLKEIHSTMDIANAEVERLNKLADERSLNTYYWWEVARFTTDLFLPEVTMDGYDLKLDD